MLEFFTEQRGITLDTLERFNITTEDSTGCFPYTKGVKYRRHDPDGTRHFWQEPKGRLGLFHAGELKGSGDAYLVEGETDAMRLYQELGGADVFALPGIETWDDSYADYFKNYDKLFVAFDNDEDYKVSTRVKNARLAVRKAVGRKTRQVHLPQGTKDICEFFDTHSTEGWEIIVNDRSRLWHYEALDLSKNPGPIDWMAEDLFAKGDLTLLIGEPGVGKSWIAMSLAVAVAEGHDEWLGRGLSSRNARVLYVDEENPEALVLRRLRRLGLTDTGIQNTRFLHRQGIRLDRNPELLLDEAMDWEPDLIILDSLTRMHTRDENHAGEVAGLFNDGINPLARETGATAFLLHHVTKTESPSSFARARGSGDISASVDTGLDARQTSLHGEFNVALYKSRWIEEGQLIRCQREDNGEYTEIRVADARAF